VLVTGARGMLGGAVARALAARGDAVTVLQRGPSGLPFPEVRADLGDPEAPLDRAVAGHDAVVHLAAKVDVVGSWREYARTNVDGTRALLAAARRAGVSRFVHVSSPSVAHAGTALVGAPAALADPARARGHYARSKALAEQVALGARGLAVVAVRPHLVWGPGDPQLVGRIVARARAGRLPVVGTGAALVDTTYVDNAVDALVAALDRAPRVAGRVFVVSNGEPRPVAELVASICAAAGVAPPRVAVPAGVARAAGAVVERLVRRDPPMTRFLAEQLSTAHWFDQRTTRSALDWTPRVGLDEGFARLRAG
jgi:nucleoside-diphosphate-sugar epimerase